MSSFHDFLTWFDGWSENIEGQPSEKQWARLCAKVADVRAVQPAPEPAAIRVQAPVVASHADDEIEPEMERRERPLKVVRKVDPRIGWRAKFLGTLMEIGYDQDSANEMMPANFDPASDPAGAARAAHSGFSN